MTTTNNIQTKGRAISIRSTPIRQSSRTQVAVLITFMQRFFDVTVELFRLISVPTHSNVANCASAINNDELGYSLREVIGRVQIMRSRVTCLFRWEECHRNLEWQMKLTDEVVLILLVFLLSGKTVCYFSP